jgi:hypothetical protein
MSRRRPNKQFGPKDRIAGLAEATEAYAETLEDPDLANVYWGKSLGLWQAFEMLAAEERSVQGTRRDRTPRSEEPWTTAITSRNCTRRVRASGSTSSAAI